MTSDQSWGQALTAGAAGALALTAVHQAAQAFTAEAPRMDVLGRRAITAGLQASGFDAPDEPTLTRWALGGDLLANSIYYSLAACGPASGAWRRGVSLGVAAGAGALLLPRPLGLGAPPRSHSLANQAMTIAWYTIGGLVTAAVATRQARRR